MHQNENSNLEERIVAFIDILGFTSIIDEVEKGNEDLLAKLFNTFEHTLDIFSDKYEYRDSIKQWKNKIDIRSFSDCICISIPTNTQINEITFLDSCRLFLSYLSLSQERMFRLGNHYLIRGGVSIGSYFSSKNLIFSKALVDAYVLESKHAIAPRILVHEKLILRIKEELNKTPFTKSHYPIITAFEDKYFFINFLNTYLVDAEETDREAEEVPNLISPETQGILNSYEHEQLEIKDRTIQEFISICQTKVQHNPDYPQSVIDKYEWLIRFLNFERSRGHAELAF